MPEEEDGASATVSSLRSKFEQLTSSSSTPEVTATRSKQQPQRSEDKLGGLRPALTDPFAEPSRRGTERIFVGERTREEYLGRTSLDSPAWDNGASYSSSSRLGSWSNEGSNLLTPQPPRQRPVSMIASTAPRITPTFRLDLLKSSEQKQNALQSGIDTSRIPPQPPARPSRIPSRPHSPVQLQSSRTPPPIPISTRPSRTSASNPDTVRLSDALQHDIPLRRTPLSPAMQMLRDYSAASDRARPAEATPPPIPNRPDKPKFASKRPPPPPSRATNDSLNVATASEEKVSPFSTPPSSPDKPERPQGSSEDYMSYFTSQRIKRTSLITLNTPSPPLTQPSAPLTPSRPQSFISRGSSGTDLYASKILDTSHVPQTRASIDSSELRPVLPPRPKGFFGLQVRKSSIRGRSASPPRVAQNEVSSEPPLLPKFEPPPQRISVIKARSPSRNDKNESSRSVSVATNSTGLTSTNEEAREDDDDSSGGEDPNSDDSLLDEYPDVSQANRRRPVFKTGISEINCKSSVRLFVVCGQYVCTASHSTRVWNVTTGDCIMSIDHGETTKITAIAFKPSTDILNEGATLWLGTNNGELLEVDIPTQRVVDSRASAHTKKEIVRIHRHGYELWTLDEGGKLQIWAPDVNGVPNLRNSPTTFRISNKHVFSMVVGSQLWMGTGRNVYVYAPSPDPNVPFNVLPRPLAPLKYTGEVTCGCVVDSEPDKVFFGHSDGKVSVYSRSTLSCIDVVNVSLYRINSMAGVGKYLWAGFKTGMMYVYDIRAKPWRAIKDWQAHEGPIEQVIADKSSLWKLDRYQVVSLGSDNYMRLWDGMLEDDWLEHEMQMNDVDFCDFREVKALVCTWNAGASKPQDLLQDPQDCKFLEEVLGSINSPDIIVFGFQELVDLEDKKITAKTLLKPSRKKRDQDKQERMSHQYRLWLKQLTKSIEQYMPRDTHYHLLHSANLVGLFTCIFVKATERVNIRNVSATTVKRGLGGLHGNKGALIVRFLLDDSSLCFINCHLAAGQSHCISRNNDIAAILESASLPPELDKCNRTDMFVGGGDGSMILDHEICILNGDLNYRIDMHRDSIIYKIQRNDLESLLDRDQLLVERKKNPGFRLRVFNEMPIRFAPTYKYDVGTDKYDTSEKKRAPAWCDRLLFRGLDKIQQLSYRRHEVRVSDHRPVSGSFLIRVKTVTKKRAAVWEMCLNRYKEVKKECVLQAKLDYLVSICGYEMEQAKEVDERWGLLT